MTTDDDPTVPCIVCGRVLRHVMKRSVSGKLDFNQPGNATSFTSAGHYGSTLFDPMNGTLIEINVCDGCLNRARVERRVLYHPDDRPMEVWS